MFELVKGTQWDGESIVALSTSKEALIKEVPEFYIEYDGTWISEIDLEFFKGNVSDEREAWYYWIRESNTKIV